MMPVLFPLGNYYFIGLRYFRDPVTFAVGTALVCGLYWLSIVVLTLAVKQVIRWFPDVRQALPRTLVMLAVVGGLTVVLAIFDVWTYSLIPVTGVRFTWAAVQPIWILGFIFDVFLCIALSVFYTYAQWKTYQTENEQLKRTALQHQFDTLKGQLSPHFLFNSLNSLSSLIGDDPARAEQFVDDLSKVYRYLLQAGNHQWISLQAELRFITIYAGLLQTRYGSSLRIEQQVARAYLERSLPPLSLQTLIDNAIKHNVMLTNKPLLITISTTTDGELRVQNNRQQKTIRVETSQSGLANLLAKYRLIGNESVRIEQTDTDFTVTLPLLTGPLPTTIS
ncbi:histidine kinase [Spirosoma taeanense]|uniref:Histidine kinase n=2 Tax=Spirosoma taeanense TaxID=2735870 RepID=A0A6M5YFE5_9BACT|nr:histidine kinase [Spirosoma taeanense]